MAARKKTHGPEPTKEAARWLGYALGDLATAVSNRQDPAVPNRNAVYMAEQATEKAIKSVILLENQPFDMVHDIDVLAQQVPTDFVLPVALYDLAWLADLETTRHPDEFMVTGADDVDRAIHLALAVVDAARAHFAARGVADEDLTPG